MILIFYKEEQTLNLLPFLSSFGMSPAWSYILIQEKSELAPVAHVYKPSYSGGRDQEDRGSKPAWANSSMRPYLKNTLHKKGLLE
jgi:hypothetical protein